MNGKRSRERILPPPNTEDLGGILSACDDWSCLNAIGCPATTFRNPTAAAVRPDEPVQEDNAANGGLRREPGLETHNTNVHGS